MSSAITVNQLSKTYRVPERDAGLKAAVVSLFHRQYRDVKAVDGISFTIEPGEIVGFLGPNGAGKTTTLKMLAGLLHPSGGTLSVLDYTPAERDKAYLRQMTLVMGQRNQLFWDIPAIDSFELYQAVYRLPWDEYVRTRDEFIELLDMEDLVRKPVRNLSLGERMKVEIAGALLHKPKILFLDEPTIGLDVTMQRRIRSFVKAYNQRYQATVLLTSHYMADVEALCQRVIVIHHGKMLFDGPLKQLIAQFSALKTITVTLSRSDVDLSPYGKLIDQQTYQATLQIEKEKTADITARMLANLPITDLTVSDPPIEELIERVFAQGDSADSEPDGGKSGA